MYHTKLGIGGGSIIGIVLLLLAFWIGDMLPIAASKDVWLW
jgi:carbon starvation protein